MAISWLASKGRQPTRSLGRPMEREPASLRRSIEEGVVRASWDSGKCHLKRLPGG
jgi:hypothetical protein